MEAKSTERIAKKILNIGQPVWVLRTGGPVQKAEVVSLISVNNTTGSEEQQLVRVEWTEEGDAIKGKIVKINDVFPRSPETDKETFGSKNESPFSKQSTKEDTIDIQNENELNVDPERRQSRDEDNKTTDESVVCKICKLSLKNVRGLRTHVAKKHPTEANELKINNLMKHQSGARKVTPAIDPSVKSELNKWANMFKNISNSETLRSEEFDAAMKEFLQFLRDANNQLPGPQHPAVRYYKKRKSNGGSIRGKGAAELSNPERSNKSARERRNEQYKYDVAQYNYYNRRKKVVQNIMNADAPVQCPVKLNMIENHFKSILELSNNSQRETYESAPTKPNLINVQLQSVHRAIKATSMDTSPGSDGVLIRTVKFLDIAHIIKVIIEIILKTSYVPESLRQGRTILLYKGKGAPKELSSWRPITVYSIIRRIIEKVLDQELKRQITFHSCQRGFRQGLPGCHVNARIIDAVLQDSKKRKGNSVTAFLDVTGAFDNVGHQHIIKSLESRGVSGDLIKSIAALLMDNNVTINCGPRKTGSINVRRGVPQGGPLSPTLFNLSIDHLYREICDTQFANQFGYKLHKDQDGVILTGFADDQAVTACSVTASVRVIDGVQRRLKEIGLSINAQKSNAIIMNQGRLTSQTLSLANGDQIMSITDGESIKYLGCNFSGELEFRESTVQTLNDNLNRLTVSNLLKPDQKLNVINQYIFPKMTYPLQTAPLTKLSPTILEGTDVIIRRSVKAMLGLPANTSTAMMYAPRRFRGLGLLRCTWEAPLQHWAIAQKLSRVPDAQFQQTFNYEAESTECAQRLNLEIPIQDHVHNIKKIRQNLREKAFDEWSKCKWQGIGIQHFKDTPKANRFITEKKVLSGSEWTNAIKLNINYAPLRAVPGTGGKVAGEAGLLCRRCGRENETPAHVLGKCPNNMLLVTRRHHNVKHAVMELMKEKGYECLEEVHAIDSDGSSRYADIIAFKKENKEALIIDPTVRFESNYHDQAAKVDEEKRGIYEKCIPFYKEKFFNEFGERNFSVRGLLFGARGAIPKLTSKFFDEVGINQSHLTMLTESIIADSLGIIHNHIYS